MQVTGSTFCKGVAISTVKSDSNSECDYYCIANFHIENTL